MFKVVLPRGLKNGVPPLVHPAHGDQSATLQASRDLLMTVVLPHTFRAAIGDPTQHLELLRG
uniref:Uncharacterized protein n=1 Tax=Streptoalloteichus tenebrarius (strain ATCC 17920 / DSM 40477 / JCM 4838 / CBS 697.72 / NBRC 16177 / NCIMB 11028 / NRRL B-12390 / A12253. 1 / ISP 5477) TaxID=1933 RepID=Q2MFI2_STRSD|nr:hypothetical protein [Streptoalloteichus tenebrarius]